jgi:hypothetical protein
MHSISRDSVTKAKCRRLQVNRMKKQRLTFASVLECIEKIRGAARARPGSHRLTVAEIQKDYLVTIPGCLTSTLAARRRAYHKPPSDASRFLEEV